MWCHFCRAYCHTFLLYWFCITARLVSIRISCTPGHAPPLRGQHMATYICFRHYGFATSSYGFTCDSIHPSACHAAATLGRVCCASVRGFTRVDYAVQPFTVTRFALPVCIFAHVPAVLPGSFRPYAFVAHVLLPHVLPPVRCVWSRFYWFCLAHLALLFFTACNLPFRFTTLRATFATFLMFFAVSRLAYQTCDYKPRLFRFAVSIHFPLMERQVYLALTFYAALCAFTVATRAVLFYWLPPRGSAIPPLLRAERLPRRLTRNACRTAVVTAEHVSYDYCPVRAYWLSPLDRCHHTTMGRTLST